MVFQSTTIQKIVWIPKIKLLTNSSGEEVPTHNNTRKIKYATSKLTLSSVFRLFVGIFDNAFFAAFPSLL